MSTPTAFAVLVGYPFLDGHHNVITSTWSLYVPTRCRGRIAERLSDRGAASQGMLCMKAHVPIFGITGASKLASVEVSRFLDRGGRTVFTGEYTTSTLALIWDFGVNRVLMNPALIAGLRGVFWTEEQMEVISRASEKTYAQWLRRKDVHAMPGCNPEGQAFYVPAG